MSKRTFEVYKHVDGREPELLGMMLLSDGSDVMAVMYHNFPISEDEMLECRPVPSPSHPSTNQGAPQNG